MPSIKVLMVYPSFPPSFWSFEEAVRLMRLKATMPPTGLVTVAAMLPRDVFDILPIVDMNVEPLLDEHLQNADVVMFSAMIAQRESLRKSISQAKKMGKKVIVGGPFATSYREEVLAMGADHLVLNEAEQTLAPFIADFVAGKAVEIYDEKSVLSRSTVSLSKEGKPFLDQTPVPRWDLLNLKNYSSLAIQYSRGCPFDCKFCDITVLYGQESRTKSPKQMILEFNAILATGFRGSIFLVDDNFIGNITNVREFLPVLIKWQREHNFPFSLFTEASVNLANKNMRDIREGMVLAGFRDVFCGIESTNLDVLIAMKKGQNAVGDLGEKVHVLQKAGLEVTAGFIVGNDDDKETVFVDLLRFIQENGIVIAMAGLLTALRHTRLYNSLKDSGRLRAETSGTNTHRFEFNFNPILDETFLIEGYVKLLEDLYSAQNYYERCRVLRDRRGKILRSGQVNGSWIRATAIVFFRNLILRPSWPFARFILGTLVKRPLYMSEAVTQAVKFEHFRKITKAAVSAHRYPQKVETLTERFQARVHKLQGDLDIRLQKLAILERKYKAKALKKYRSLDPHFRADAKKALADLCKRFKYFAENCRREWQGRGAYD